MSPLKFERLAETLRSGNKTDVIEGTKSGLGHFPPGRMAMGLDHCPRELGLNDAPPFQRWITFNYCYDACQRGTMWLKREIPRAISASLTDSPRSSFIVHRDRSTFVVRFVLHCLDRCTDVGGRADFRPTRSSGRTEASDRCWKNASAFVPTIFDDSTRSQTRRSPLASGDLPSYL